MREFQEGKSSILRDIHSGVFVVSYALSELKHREPIENA